MRLRVVAICTSKAVRGKFAVELREKGARYSRSASPQSHWAKAGETRIAVKSLRHPCDVLFIFSLFCIAELRSGVRH